jgi:hypothetical protein
MRQERKRAWRRTCRPRRAAVLGLVEAPGREIVEAAAVVRFNLSEEQRGRLVIREIVLPDDPESP